MSPDSYTGSISTFLGKPSQLPPEWMPCNGQTLLITQATMLYSIIGNRYGGSPASQTFALPSFNANGQPDAQGRLVVICVGGQYPVLNA
ncbi:tail fiber protein [Novispirillum itersonii]|uniref:Microcystin-dependent protein n=1 Tax=Novispirillum itersonii TaxID=189 RepID=A0A7X0DLU3_NOVIT|nr:tail fiber protein [Novispirillum itersonii]MBB6210363.1 microcystin-dependent protein [Novispirillum itersonii]